MVGPEEAHKEHINKYKMAHMIGVAEYMRERAKDYNLDPDKMYVIGLLHDVGYLEGHIGHEETGAEILSEMGFNQEYINAIRNHGYNPYEIYKDIQPTATDILLLEADMSIDKEGHRVGLEKRLEDITKRYGNDGYEMASSNIKFIKEYQKEHGIGKPYSLYHKYHNRSYNAR